MCEAILCEVLVTSEKWILLRMFIQIKGRFLELKPRHGEGVWQW